MASECTTDSECTAASAAPLTGESAVTRHAPLGPPLKVVNMRVSKRGTGWGSRGGVIPGWSEGPDLSAQLRTGESRDSGFDASHRPGTTEPVNSRENPNNSRNSPRPPYIHRRLARASDSGQKSAHALHAPISRRSARPASGFGSRRPAREVEAGGAGVEGAVAVPAGEITIVYRQRPEGF